MVSATLHVVVVGTGLVGSAFLDQLWALKHASWRVVMVVNSTHFISDVGQVETAMAMAGKKKSAWVSKVGTPYTHLLLHLPPSCSSSATKVVVVDCTASALLPELYPILLTQGYAVVTANKKGLVENLLFPRLQPFLAHSLFYESTVGAGLPVLATARDLLETGDPPLRIEGILSGSLSFLFNQHATNISEGVRMAKQLGFTEPDPRDDLDGMDVARKLVILARTCGWFLTLEEVKVFSLIPESLSSLPLEPFLEQLDQVDTLLAPYLPTSPSTVLRYAGVLDFAAKKATVGLQLYPTTHPFAHLSSCDNCIQFLTHRFPRGLCIQGAGAGDQVTAFGITSDLLKIHRRCS